jgi:hypothetical protein
LSGWDVSSGTQFVSCLGLRWSCSFVVFTF